MEATPVAATQGALVALTLTAAGRTFAMKLLCEYDNPLSTEHDILAHFARFKTCEPEVCEIMARAVKPGDRVVDGGANIGYFSILLSQLVGEAGKVFAVEPDPFNVIKLQNNFKHNDCTNITIVPQPLWAAGVVKDFHACEHNGWGSVFAGLNHGDARVRTLNRVTMATLNDIDPPLKLIKLDIEGSELPALCGGFRHIARGAMQCPFVVCEINDTLLTRVQMDQHMIFNLMRGHGYEVYLLHATAPPQHVPQSAALVPKEGDKQVLANVLFATPDAMREIMV